MFQRRQSLYMMVAIAAIVLSYFLPFGNVDESVPLAIRSYGVKDGTGNYLTDISSYWFHLPLSASALLTAIALFSFTNRKRQIAFLRLTVLLYALSLVLLALYVSKVQSSFSNAHLSIGISLFLVPIALIANWMAARFVKKDDELVRSVDRIR